MSTLPFQESFNFLEQIKSSGSVMFHVKLFFVTDVIVDTAFAKYRIHPVVLSDENIAELFLAFNFFHELFRFDFLAKFVNKSVDEII